MTAGHRIYYVPPRLVGHISEWSGRDADDGKSWVIDQAKAGKFNAIWFSPMQETTNLCTEHKGTSYSGSVYAIRNHFALDPDFSSHPEITDRAKVSKPEELATVDADDRHHLGRFAQKAKEDGITLYADLVLNHVARDHPLATTETEYLEQLVKDCRENNRTIKRIYSDANSTPNPHRHNREGELQLIGIEHENEEGGCDQVFFKFKRDHDLTLSLLGPPGGEVPWSDLAHINYASPEAMEFFLTGRNSKSKRHDNLIEGKQDDDDDDTDGKGYWKKLIDWYADLGFTSFRCDAAHMVPPCVWEIIINYAHDKLGDDAVFMAETLGGPHEAIVSLGNARISVNGKDLPAFDLGMHSHYWWDFVASWLTEEEVPRLHKMSKYGGAGSPDNHDTPNTLAGGTRLLYQGHDGPEQDRIVATVSIRDYAVAALTTNTNYMQMGYEYCNEDQNSVFRNVTTPADWHNLREERKSKDHPLNIQNGIAEINDLKKGLGIENCRTEFHSTIHDKNDRLVLIHCNFIDIDSEKIAAKVVLLINKDPGRGLIRVAKQEIAVLKENNQCSEVKNWSGSDDEEYVTVSDIVILHTPLMTGCAIF